MPQTSSSVAVVPLCIAVHVVPSKRRMTPFDPTANTFVSLVPQIPTIVSRVGVCIARHASPLQRRITPSCPEANTDVGLETQTPSNDTSVSPWRSTPHAVADGLALTTVTVEVAFN